jgi:hypothetical protein
MDSNIVLVIAIIAVVGLVIFQEVAKKEAKFEDNEHHREMVSSFFKGFRDGLDARDTNSRIFVDDILKRVGFTAPEMTLGGTVKATDGQPLEDTDDIPPVVLDHETQFDLEDIDLKDEGAGWVDKNWHNDSPTNTPPPFDQENPHT